jgi:hypothetical protein
MKGDKHQTTRMHLLTNPKQRDVFMSMPDASGPEPAVVVPTPVSDSYWEHPSQADVPTAL